MTQGTQNPLEHPEVQLASSRGYLLSFVISVALMTISLWMVKGHAISPVGLLMVTSVIAGIVIIVQGYLLLHMDLSDAQIWHTVAMVLFVPLFIVTIGLTAWMFHGLYARTMIMPAAMSGMPGMTH